jgi:hypothetical protein
MPRTCLACVSPERAAIDKALAAGEPLRNIAKRVSISHAALFRHKSHVKEAIEELGAAKSFSSLPPQKQKYVEGLAEGKTKVQAALDAGYSPAMARSATHNIETPDVRAAFAALMRKRIPPEKIVQRIEEGLDAKETKFFQEKGVVTDQRDVVAYGERRQYAELAAQYGGYHVPPSRDEGRAPVQIVVTVGVIGSEDEDSTINLKIPTTDSPEATSEATAADAIEQPDAEANGEPVTDYEPQSQLQGDQLPPEPAPANTLRAAPVPATESTGLVILPPESPFLWSRRAMRRFRGRGNL